MSDNIEFWTQCSDTKGLRIIRFKIVNEDRSDRLLWIGPLGEPDDEDKFYYDRQELLEYGWEKIE
jgi:hypothetical protein